MTYLDRLIKFNSMARDTTTFTERVAVFFYLSPQFHKILQRCRSPPPFISLNHRKMKG